MVEEFDAKAHRTLADAEVAAKKLNVCVRQFYRIWGAYDGSLRSLHRAGSDGGRGRSRLQKLQLAILTRTVRRLYKIPDAATREKVIETVQESCRKKGIPKVSESTIRRFMRGIPARDLATGKYGRTEADNMLGPAPGRYKEATAPLRVIQIDHTPLDLELVDTETGKIIGRAWLTVAIDVYSRMVVGLYLSFEDPNTGSVAMAIYRAVVPKDSRMKQLDVKGEWPVWGMMRTIHADNGPDFRTKELTMACNDHKMDIQWRPSKNPRYGAHIERLAKTINKEIQKLNGRIPADFKQRKHEDPESNAICTLWAAEQYLVTYIVDVYHKKYHKGIKTSPIRKYMEGMLGGVRPQGVPRPIADPTRLLLDLTPSVERTVQRQGIEIDNMFYYDPRLNRFIHARDPKNNRLARKFRCRTPIDDALVIYFQNPDTKEYWKIQCADRSMPSMTRHELRLINENLREKGIQAIDMKAIKEGRKRLAQLENEILAKAGKSSAARKVRRRRAITESLKQNGSPLPHKVEPVPPAKTPPQDYDLSDIPIFKVDE